MARRRMIDPNIWQSEDVSQLTYRQRLLLIGLFSNADDEGKGRGNANHIRSTVFPYDDISKKEIESDLENIRTYISIQFYSINGSHYYKFDNWSKWQRVDKPQVSMLPNPPELVRNDSGIIPEQVEIDSVLKEEKGKEEEDKRKEENNIPFDEIILHLNKTAGTDYKSSTKTTREHVRARWREGYRLHDFITVIDKKYREWKGTDQEQYIRPETLFGTKFEGYLNQKEVDKNGGSGAVRGFSPKTIYPEAAREDESYWRSRQSP